jgi:hypothetical protein
MRRTSRFPGVLGGGVLNETYQVFFGFKAMGLPQ